MCLPVLILFCIHSPPLFLLSLQRFLPHVKFEGQPSVACQAIPPVLVRMHNALPPVLTLFPLPLGMHWGCCCMERVRS